MSQKLYSTVPNGKASRPISINTYHSPIN